MRPTMNATGDLAATATQGREARIVARRKRIEERIGAKAEGDGARPARAAHCVLRTASPDGLAPRLAAKSRGEGGPGGSSEESRSKTQVAETRSRIDRIKVRCSPGLG